MLDPNHLTAFVVMSEELHFTRAADRLHIAQSALSLKIKSLEQQLGVRLFERNKRSLVRLTKAGSLFLTNAKRALDELDRAEAIGRQAGRGDIGTITLAYIGATAFSGVLASTLSAHRQKRPGISVKLIEMSTPSQIEALQRNEIDAGFARPRQNFPDTINSRVIHDEPLVLAVPAGTKNAKQALRDDRLVVPQFDQDPGFIDYLSGVIPMERLLDRRHLRVKDFIAALTLVGSGQGVAIVPKSFRRIAMPNVSWAELAAKKTSIKTVLLSRKRETSPAIKFFVDLCQRSSS